VEDVFCIDYRGNVMERNRRKVESKIAHAFFLFAAISVIVSPARGIDDPMGVTAGAAGQCLGGRASGDVDGDGDRDWTDYAAFVACLSGPTGKPGAGCECFDFDNSGHIDLWDGSQVHSGFDPRAGCMINGVFYAAGTRDAYPRNCSICDPELSTTEWSAVQEGTVCREGSGDICDPDEVCTGTPGTGCPADHVAMENVVCRAGSGDMCDPPEFCTHVPGAVCPEDVVASTDLVCRSGSGDVCNPEERCSGIPGQACPEDVFASAETLCREGSGDICDPDEYCSGTPGHGCPADHIANTSVVCRAGTGDLCDPPEFCTHEPGVPCPDDVVEKAGTVCRAAPGGCDVEETCSGAPGEACPADARRPADTICREAAGLCDVAEVCNGVSPFCPLDAYLPAETLCRAAGVTIEEDGTIFIDGDGLCDFPEYCTGTNPNCPPDQLRPDGAPCRQKAGPCDVTDVCTGSDKHCPTLDAKEPDTTLCKNNSDTCREDVYCDGVNNACPGPGAPIPVGSPCDHVDCRNAGVCTIGAKCVCPGIHICRESAGYCDETGCHDVCDAAEYYRPNGTCPPDGVLGTNYSCRTAFDIINGGISPCNPPEYCDGVNKECPPDIVAEPGYTCRDGGACEVQYYCLGLCNPPGGPFAPKCRGNFDCDPGAVCEAPTSGFVQLTCEPIDDGPADGTPCSGNGVCLGGECTSLISGKNGRCEGYDTNFRGNLDGFHCDGNADVDLICCNGENVARTGQIGTCQQCCRDRDEDLGGCPENNADSIVCCDGLCVDLEDDGSNCGECGNDCNSANVELGACAREGTGECSLGGYCHYGSVCLEGWYCIPDDEPVGPGYRCLPIPGDDVRGKGDNDGRTGALCWTNADCLGNCLSNCDTVANDFLILTCVENEGRCE